MFLVLGCGEGKEDSFALMVEKAPAHIPALLGGMNCSAGIGRLFTAAVGATQSPRGPGSASSSWSTGHVGYGGSRKLAQRFEYKEGSGAGFAKLHPDHTPTGDQFLEMLEGVSGVTDIEWQTFKPSQGNHGNH